LQITPINTVIITPLKLFIHKHNPIVFADHHQLSYKSNNPKK